MVDVNAAPKRKIKPSSLNIIQPVLLGMEPWSKGENERNSYDIRPGSSQSEILYYNKGYGKGFAICINCGRMIKENTIAGTDEDNNPSLHNHKHLTKGVTCSGSRERNGIRRNVLLVGRYQTDLVEIRFRNEKHEFINGETLWTLGFILSRKLAEYLGIESSEINFGVNEVSHSIFIFDTQLGGAGYSSRFPLYKQEVLGLAYDALNQCKCKKACIFCLIDRDSQWYMDKLDRKAALKWLEYERCSRWTIPEKIKAIDSTTIQITSNLTSELIPLLRNPELKEVIFFISNDIASWIPNEWLFEKNRIIQDLKLRGKDVKLTMINREIDLSALSISDLTTLLHVSNLNPLYFVTYEQQLFYSLIIVKFNNGEIRHYFTDKESINYRENWGKDCVIYQSKNIKVPLLTSCFLDFSSLQNDNRQIMFDMHITKRSSDTNSLGELICRYNPEKWNLIKNQLHAMAKEDKQVSISYVDTYLKTPLACLMLIHLIKWITNDFDVLIKKLELNIAFKDNIYSQYNSLVSQDFTKSNSRDNFITKCSEELLQIAPLIHKDKYLPHFRELKIENSHFELLIRPDGGIGYGWNIDRRHEQLKDYELEDDLNQNIRLYNKEWQGYGILYSIGWKRK
jgi:hypothetical protein